jgi:hypothetical protein
MEKKLLTAVLLVAAFVLGLGGGLPPPVRAEYDSIKQPDLANVIHAGVVTPSGTFTQTRAFTALHRTINQSVQVQGTGTSPNYKVEMLISLDHDPEHQVAGTFTKPETGGDLGTFTDQNAHVISVGVPLSVAHKLKITELGGNQITIEAYELSQ